MKLSNTLEMHNNPPPKKEKHKKTQMLSFDKRTDKLNSYQSNSNT